MGVPAHRQKSPRLFRRNIVCHMRCCRLKAAEQPARGYRLQLTRYKAGMMHLAGLTQAVCPLAMYSHRQWQSCKQNQLDQRMLACGASGGKHGERKQAQCQDSCSHVGADCASGWRSQESALLVHSQACTGPADLLILSTKAINAFQERVRTAQASPAAEKIHRVLGQPSLLMSRAVRHSAATVPKL